MMKLETFNAPQPIADLSMSSMSSSVNSVNSIVDFSAAFQTLPSTRKGKQELPSSFSPHAYSVILGRGKIGENVGNRRLKIVVDMELANYQKAPSRREKSFVVARVLDTFQSACHMGAFVRRENGVWYEVPDTEAREKISTMFRDKLSHQYKSSTSNKVKRRRQRKALKKQLSSSSSSSSTNGSCEDALMTKPISFVNMDLSRVQAELHAADAEGATFDDCSSMISV